MVIEDVLALRDKKQYFPPFKITKKRGVSLVIIHFALAIQMNEAHCLTTGLWMSWRPWPTQPYFLLFYAKCSSGVTDR